MPITEIKDRTLQNGIPEFRASSSANLIMALE